MGKEEITTLPTDPPEPPLPPPAPAWESPQQRYGHLSYQALEVLYLDAALDDDREALEWFKSKRGPETPGMGPRMPKL